MHGEGMTSYKIPSKIDFLQAMYPGIKTGYLTNIIANGQQQASCNISIFKITLIWNIPKLKICHKTMKHVQCRTTNVYLMIWCECIYQIWSFWEMTNVLMIKKLFIAILKWGTIAVSQEELFYKMHRQWWLQSAWTATVQMLSSNALLKICVICQEQWWSPLHLQKVQKTFTTRQQNGYNHHILSQVFKHRHRYM